MGYLELAALIGTFAFALSGALIGIRQQLDIMGVFILAFLTASGGGMVRDIFLNNIPAILTNTQSFYITSFIIITFKLLKIDHEKHAFEEKRLFVISDTAGLIAFAIHGTLQGIAYDLSIFGVLTICFLTAVGGGILRDVLVNKIPGTLQLGFYGTSAIIVGLVIYIFDFFGVDLNLILPSVFILGVAMRLCAIAYKIQLPRL